MLIRKPADIRPSEITSKGTYLNRRKFIQSTVLASGSMLAGAAGGAIIPAEKRAKLPDVGNSEFSTDEAPNSYTDITTYNNYYEFGIDKGDPLRNSQEFEHVPGRSRFRAMRTKRAISILRTSSSRMLWKSASIDCVA